jgi:hypothetical protein
MINALSVIWFGRRGRSHKHFLLRLVIAIFLFAGKAHGESISYSFSSGPMTGSAFAGGSRGNPDGHTEAEQRHGAGYGNWVWKFDPAMGTLNDIRFTLDLDLSISANFTYITLPWPAQPDGSVSHSIYTETKIGSYYGNNTFISYDTVYSGNSFIVPKNGTAGDSLELHSSQSGTVFDPSLLAQFIGSADMIQLYADARSTYYYNGFYAQGATSAPDIQLNYTVIYDFTPVPEPSTTALGVIGLLVLVS